MLTVLSNLITLSLISIVSVGNFYLLPILELPVFRELKT